jgi:Flp pilus assembly protein TadD
LGFLFFFRLVAVSCGGEVLLSMRQRSMILVMFCVWAGCESPTQERVQNYNQDGVQLFQTGYYCEALESFQAAQNLAPDDAGLYYNIGECYDRLGKTARAEQNYTECIQRAANHAECRHALACLLVKTGRRAEAEHMVQSWLEREPQRAAAYAEDGALALQAGDLPRAQARLQQALALDPHDTRALIELGRAYEAMHRPERAAELYERALKRDPADTEIAKRLDLLRSQGSGQPQPE